MPIDITDQTRRVQYAISGTGPYDFDFEILDESDIAVYRDDTLLTLTTHYTVTINSDGTGAVTLVSATGDVLTVVGARPYRRITDYATGGDFRASTLNDELDSLQIQILQLVERFERAVLMSVSSTYNGSLALPEPGAGNYLRWNAGGTAIEAVSAVNDPGSITTRGSISRSLTAHLGSHEVNVFEWLSDAQITNVIARGSSYDLTDEIQAALDYVATTGGRLRLPSGRYIAGELSVTGIGVLDLPVSIVGDGSGVTIIESTGAVNPLLEISSSVIAGPVMNRFTVEGLQLKTGSDELATNLMTAKDLAYFRMSDLQFEGNQTSLTTSLQLLNCLVYEIQHILIRDADQIGIDIDYDSAFTGVYPNMNRLQDVHVVNCGVWGIRARKVAMLSVMFAQIERCGDTNDTSHGGIFIDDWDPSGAGVGATFNEVWMEALAGVGMRIGDSATGSRISVKNSHCLSTGGVGGATGRNYGFYIPTANAGASRKANVVLEGVVGQNAATADFFTGDSPTNVMLHDCLGTTGTFGNSTDGDPHPVLQTRLLRNTSARSTTGIATLGTATATPTLTGTTKYATGNSGAQNVTNFVGGEVGQEVTIYGADGGNTTFVHGANFILDGAANNTLADNESIRMLKIAATPKWLQIV